MQRPDLKALLAAGQALLEPPAPLPSTPGQLLARLRASSALLPWRTRPGWTEEDELEDVRDSDEDVDPLTRRARRDQLVQLVGQRSLDIVVAMQAWLEKEFWPPECRPELDTRDFLLGTADMRLLRLLLQHALISLLLPLTLSYVAHLPAVQADPRLSPSISLLLSLAHTRPPPDGSSSSAFTASGVPPSAVTQALQQHLPSILLAALAVGWTPSVPPQTHAGLRSSLLATIAALSPKHAMGALSTTSRLAQAKKRTWPAYVAAAIGPLLSAQIMRPGGVRAVLENSLGEAATLSPLEAVDTPKMHALAGLFERVPRGVAVEETYTAHVMDALLGLIGPAQPVVYSHAAAYVVQHLWDKLPSARAWLDKTLHAGWSPEPREGVALNTQELETMTSTAAQLVFHAPPSPAFIDFVVAPILPQLFALYAFLNPQTRSIEKRAQTPLSEHVGTLLSSWGKLVSVEDGVKGVWAIVDSGRGWPESEDGKLLHFQNSGAGVQLVYGRPPEAEIEGMDVDDGDMPDIDLHPSPSHLTSLLKSLDRPDLSSTIFLRVLNEWRVRTSTDAGDPLRALLFLRLSMALMESPGKLLSTNPEHVLAFVEGVLADEAEAVPTSSKMVQEVSEELPDLTPEGVEKLGQAETAISLLLATLEANESLNHASSSLLHPISAHLDALAASSSSVGALAREAQLVLLLRRSASLTSSSPQTSETISTYQRALKLVTDPLLPVRAHGLVLLRDLVLSPAYDAALTPAILDIYLQSILDADSYIYLNAVKGLAAMCDALGGPIFKRLVREYVDVGGGERVDRSLRIGEALGMVIERKGEAFASSVNDILPTLLALLPRPPTVMQVSALSLLSTAVEVAPLALLPWSDELVSSTLDILETTAVVVSKDAPAVRKVMLVDDDEPEAEEKPRIVDAELGEDSRHPALRRAAAYLLTIFLSSFSSASDPSSPAAGDEVFKMRLPGQTPVVTAPQGQKGRQLDARVLNRADAVLGYVSTLDVDEIVRAHCREALESVKRLQVASQLLGPEVRPGKITGREFLG